MKNNLHLFILSFVLTLLSFQGEYLLAQGWERNYGSNVEDNAHAAIQTLDEGYAILGFSESTSSTGTNVTLIKTDENGQQQWVQSFGGVGDDKGFDLVQDADGAYIMVGQTSSMGSGENDVLLIKTNSEGKELWRKAYGSAFNDRGFSISIAQNGDYILTGRTALTDNSSTNVYLLRTDTDGNVKWEKSFGGERVDIGESVIETTQGEIIIVGQTKSFATPNPASPNAPSADVYFIKTDANGEVLVEKTFGNIEQDIAFDVVETAEGNFALTGVTSNNSDIYLLMLDTNGNELWSKSYGGIFEEIAASIALAEDGGFVIAGFKTVTPSSSQIYVLKTDAQGNLEWERLFGAASGQNFGRSVANTKDGGYIISGIYDVSNDPGSILPLYDMYLIKTDGQGNIFKNLVQGTVHRDMNTNCEKDADEKTLKNWLVRLKKGEEIFYATTDENGNYTISVEDGKYNVGLLVLNTAWEVCQNYNVTFSGSDTMKLDFATRSTVEDCPVLVVDVSTALLEPCQDANYTINVCNRGIETAFNSYIDVQFDPYLTVNYSTLPWTDHVGNIYRFNLGDLVIEECGSFEVNTTVNCNSAVGQAHCVEVYAHPDPICIPPPPLWDGASIKVEGNCVGDSVQFIIKNIGDGDMLAPQGFVIIEDHVEFRIGPDFQLPSLEADTFYLPATSSTYRVVAEQPPGHPYGETASAAVEGCPFGQAFNTGFLTSFSNADALPFYAVDCRENKVISGNAAITPSPKGVGTANNITNKDDLEYHIYFENTGSDTVNHIIIRDTISEFLDISTLAIGASSHPYDFEISGSGILKITISDITLLSASEDDSKSFGFIKFKIAQKRENPVGTVIENKAVIHFDYGTPIFTNTTAQTIGGDEIEDFIKMSTSTENVYLKDIAVKIQPNPFDGASGAQIELIGLQDAKNLQFQLFDLRGKAVQQQYFNNTKFQFYPVTLPQGLYIYTIQTESGALINSGKVFIK